MGVRRSLARVPDTAVEVRPTVSTATHEHAGHAGHAWPALRIGVDGESSTSSEKQSSAGARLDLPFCPSIASLEKIRFYADLRHLWGVVLLRTEYGYLVSSH